MPDLSPARHIVIRTQRSRNEVQAILAGVILPRKSWLSQFARETVDRPDYAGSIAGNSFRMNRRARYALLAPVVRGAIHDDAGGARVEADVLLVAAPQVVVLIMFVLLMAAGYAMLDWCGAGFFALILLANALLYVIPFSGEARKAERWLRGHLEGGAQSVQHGMSF